MLVEHPVFQFYISAIITGSSPASSPVASAFQFYISAIITFDVTGLLGVITKFQFYISAIITEVCNQTKTLS